MRGACAKERALRALSHLAQEAIYLNGDQFGPAVGKFLLHCQGLRAYLSNNEGALMEYGDRYRSGRPISTSRAEASVDEIANVRMAICLTHEIIPLVLGCYSSK